MQVDRSLPSFVHILKITALSYHWANMKLCYYQNREWVHLSTCGFHHLLDTWTDELIVTKLKRKQFRLFSLILRETSIIFPNVISGLYVYLCLLPQIAAMCEMHWKNKP